MVRSGESKRCCWMLEKDIPISVDFTGLGKTFLCDGYEPNVLMIRSLILLDTGLVWAGLIRLVNLNSM